MAKLKTIDLTRRESQIMEILYRRRRATVEEIRSELPDSAEPLERAQAARHHDRAGPAGPRVRRPAIRVLPRGETRSRQAGPRCEQLVRTFFDNSPGSAIAALLDMTSTPLTPARTPTPPQPARTALANREMSNEPSGSRPRGVFRTLDDAQSVIVLAVAALVEAVIRRRRTPPPRDTWCGPWRCERPAAPVARRCCRRGPSRTRTAPAVAVAAVPTGERVRALDEQASHFRRPPRILRARSRSRWHQPVDRAAAAICGRRARDADRCSP